ncbi:putative protein YneK [Escherichia coli]
MVTPVKIIFSNNHISLPDDFPVRNIAPQVKEVLKDFIDVLKYNKYVMKSGARL